MKKAKYIAVTIAILLAILAAFLWLFDVALAESVTMYAICRDSPVNIRERPSTKARIGGYLEFGWEAEVTDSQTDKSGTLWYRVEGITEQGYGWVCGQYLIDSKPEKVSITCKVVASGRVAVYGRVNGKRKAWVKPGQKLKVTVYSDSWCLTEKGYVKTAYLEEVE